jgi:hypothetical protein
MLLDRLLYGVNKYHYHKTAVTAVLLNTCILIFYAQNYHGPLTALVAVMIATFVGYEVFPFALGFSTLWSFMYGYNTKSNLDNAVFVMMNIVIFFVPQEYRPWTKGYEEFTVIVHCLFAIIGVLYRQELSD